jgi:hypothetical protein
VWHFLTGRGCHAQGSDPYGTVTTTAGGDLLRQSAFQRRMRVDYGSPIGKVYVHSPEDLILYKLMSLGLSGQPKHARDIAAILRAKKDQLDLGYIEEWVTRLGLDSVWKEMLDSLVQGKVTTETKETEDFLTPTSTRG